MKTKGLAAAWVLAMACVVGAGAWFAADAGAMLLSIRAEFLLFALTLLGVAVFHERTLEVAVVGLVAIVVLKLLTDASFEPAHQLLHEAPTLINLLGLLLGFAILARHFELSQVPEMLPRVLPDDWKGGLVLLVLVFVLSSFLDNIAAAMIGGTVAMHVYRGRVAIGFLAAIVAASNAGGSGSVVGDTTTTMMWIAGVPALDVAHAYIAAVPALAIVAVIAARAQQRVQPIQKGETGHSRLIWPNLSAVALILVGAIAANVLLGFPAAGVWAAIALAAAFTKTDWRVIPAALKGSLFLLSLVASASLMPVETLPPASWQTALLLGIVSAVFDNIPLTKLALDQGGYDWGVLAFAVGYGGSMMWFGSSAGVALSTLFPQARSVGGWLRHGWPVIVGYVAGFAVLLALWGWHPPG